MKENMWLWQNTRSQLLANNHLSTEIRKKSVNMFVIRLCIIDTWERLRMTDCKQWKRGSEDKWREQVEQTGKQLRKFLVA